MSLEYLETSELESEHPRPEFRVPLPIYTIVLLGCIIAAMLAQVSSGLERSIDLAGFSKEEFRNGEYWRILTGAVIHGGFLHIFFNGYALYSFGRLMELLTNRAHLAMVFLLAAVGGGFLSLYFLPYGVSVGASGGIVGLIGYLLIYAFRRRRFISAEFRRSLLINIGFILVFGIVLFQIVDNYGHIGGLLTGIVYGLIQIPSDKYKNPQDSRFITKIAGGIAVGIYVLSTAFVIILLFGNR